MSTHPFVGTWRLVSFEIRTANGEVSYPFGEDAAGYLIYSQDGYMAASIMDANRARFASSDFRASSPEEKRAAFDTYITYCGTYEVKDDKVTHHAEISLFPNWSGTDQERFFEISGDQLTLRTPPTKFEGDEITGHLIWQRTASR